MSTEATPPPASAPETAAPAVETVTTPPPATQATPPAKPEGDKPAETPGQPTLEEAMSQFNMDGLTAEQMDDLDSGDPVRVAKALGVKEPAVPAKKEDAAATTDKPATTPPAQEDEGPARVSIRALNASQRAKMVQALDAIRSGKPAEEAFAEHFGLKTPTATDKPTDAPQEQPVPIVAPTVKALEDKLAALKADYDQKKAEFDPSAQDILEEMQDVKLDLREAKREAEHAARIEADFMSKQAESHERAMAKFADLITESPDFLEYCEAEIVLAERKNDPVMSKPDWPENIGQRVKDKYFKASAANSASAEGDKSQPIPPAPHQKVRIPGSPVGPAFAPGTLTSETALAEFDKLTPEQKDAAMEQIAKLTSKPR